MQADYSREFKRIPNHIAFIPDGNRRWAREQNLPVIKGHEVGIENIRKIVEWVKEYGIKEVTFWGFSTENRSRSKEEVEGLMKLFETKLMEIMNEAQRKKDEVDVKVVVRFYGDLNSLPGKLLDYINKIHEKTRGIHEYDLKVNILLNYGGIPEIVSAFRAVAEDYKKGKIDRIEEDTIKKYLWTGEVSPPDVIVRTSGEMRLSGFLPIQSAYSELIFLKKYWPEFNKEDLLEVLHEYEKRERRFGK